MYIALLYTHLDRLYIANIHPADPRTPTSPSHTTYHLQLIPKLRILPISHIRKLDILHVPLAPLPLLPQQLRPPLVLPHVVALQADGEPDGRGAHDEDGDFGGDVVGGGALRESQGADDVADAEHDEEEGVHCYLDGGVSNVVGGKVCGGEGRTDFFGVPGIVRRDPGVQQRQRGANDVGEVVPDQFPHFIPIRQKRHQPASQDPRDQQRDDLEAADVVPSREVGAAEDGDGADGAGGQREQCGGLAVEAEALDQGRLIGGDGAVGDERGDGYEGEEVGLGVGEAFEDLAGFELGGLSEFSAWGG